MKQAYLRVSYTERCNLRCKYCMPQDGINTKRSHEETLSVETLLKLIGIIDSAIGVYKVRITGGEPLVRSGIETFVIGLKRLLPKAELVMTTNGVLLDKFAKPLFDAGIKRINVSVDTINTNSFKSLTRGGSIDKVLVGIKTALGVGMNIKTNTVLMKSINANCLCEIIKHLHTIGVQNIRFIELMRIGEARNMFDKEFMSVDEAIEEISSCFDMKNKHTTKTGFEYIVSMEDDKDLRIGFITTESSPFCDKCDRLRLDSAGNLRPCLLSNAYVAIGNMLKQGKSEEEIAESIVRAWDSKQEPQIREQDELMSVIGG